MFKERLIVERDVAAYAELISQRDPNFTTKFVPGGSKLNVTDPDSLVDGCQGQD